MSVVTPGPCENKVGFSKSSKCQNSVAAERAAVGELSMPNFSAEDVTLSTSESALNCRNANENCTFKDLLIHFNGFC